MSTRNQRILMGAIALCLLLSAIFFYYNNIKIPKIKIQTEAQIRAEIDETAMPSKLVAVVTAPEGIALYTEMTEEMVNEAITLLEIPTKYLVEGSIEDIEQIKGMITKYPLKYGQQLILDQFYTEDNWYGEMERLKEFEVSSLVAEEVKTGNIVDIIVNYGDGDYDVVVPKIKVRKIASNAVEEGQQQEAGYMIVLAVDEIQYRDLQLAKELGELETRLYLDSNQPASTTTFDYSLRLKEVSLKQVSSKTVGSFYEEQGGTSSIEDNTTEDTSTEEGNGSSINYKPSN